MRRLVLPLLAANGVALAAVGVSYFLYARLLTPQNFGIYTAALAAGSFAVLVLDGGVKTGVIKRERELTPGEAGGLLSALLAVAAFLLALAAVARWGAAAWGAEILGWDIILWFTVLYVATYPSIGVSTALLERRLAYRRLACIEAAAVAIERCAPAVLLLWSDLGMLSFVIALGAGRLLRLALLQVSAPVAPRLGHWGTTRSLFAEGVWFQAAGATSAIRDNLHVLVVGPLAGASWVGYYGWALQLGMMASQVFAQISARLSLPLAAQALSFQERWDSLLNQVRVLARTTAPVLASLLLVTPWLNAGFFDSKWTPALPVLALLCARMVPGVASTPLGPVLLVERGARDYALAISLWTATELAASILATATIGESGLAYSYACMAWVGIAIMISRLREHGPGRMHEVARAILGGPSVWISVVASIAAFVANEAAILTEQPLPGLLMAGLLCIACVAVDPVLRTTLLPKGSYSCA